MEEWLWCGQRGQPKATRKHLVMKHLVKKSPSDTSGQWGASPFDFIFIFLNGRKFFQKCFMFFSGLLHHICSFLSDLKKNHLAPSRNPNFPLICLVVDQFVILGEWGVINLALIIASCDQFVIYPTEVVNFVTIRSMLLWIGDQMCHYLSIALMIVTPDINLWSVAM